MFPYWLLFSFFAVGGLIGRGRETVTDRDTSPILIIGAIFIAVMIGFRDNVGSDWNAYFHMYQLGALLPLDRLMALGDPGYMALNWLAQQIGGEFWLVNLVCGSIFAWGLFRLASVQPDPYLAMLVSIPYLVVVVAMGYSRQGVAIGFLMAGLAHVSRGGGFARLIVYVAIAGLFHKTAVVALPLAMTGSKRGRVLDFIIVATAAVLLFDFLLQSQVDKFVQHYIKTRWTSQGAGIRVAMGVIPATIYFMFSKRLGFTPIEKKLWRNFAIGAYFLVGLLFVVPSSTVVDRFGLYILPLQLAVFSRLSVLFRSPIAAKSALLAYSFAVLYVWLNFADNAPDWIPYTFYTPW